MAETIPFKGRKCFPMKAVGFLPKLRHPGAIPLNPSMVPASEPAMALGFP